MTRPLRIVVLGLSLSSSWGNGHATTYRALIAALARRGHEVLFLERDAPWYAAHRDLADPDFCELAFYRDLGELAGFAPAIGRADAVIVGSYVPEGVVAGRLAIDAARGVTAFYDIDTPVTLAALLHERCAYLSAGLIPSYDVYLSFSGGPTLRRIEREFGSPMARALYCSADPELYRPVTAEQAYDLGYLGTYSEDRQPALERLLLEPARRAPSRRFIVAGPQYPADIGWPDNVTHVPHVGPAGHAEFYASCRYTLNVTRADMVRAGWSPSVRLFEAAACGAPIVSDPWPGLDDLFEIGRDILVATGPEDVLAALDAPGERAREIGAGGRARVIAGHTAAHRAAELERHLDEARAARLRGPAQLVLA